MIPIAIGILTMLGLIFGELLILNNKIDTLIKAVREKRLFPTIPATGKLITSHEMEEKQ